MKQPYIPLEKRSKREQRGYHAKQRGNWGGINPVTRKPPNPKAYNRKKSERRFDYEPHSDFCFFTTQARSSSIHSALPVGVFKVCQ